MGRGRPVKTKDENGFSENYGYLMISDVLRVKVSELCMSLEEYRLNTKQEIKEWIPLGQYYTTLSGLIGGLSKRKLVEKLISKKQTKLEELNTLIKESMKEVEISLTGSIADQADKSLKNVQKSIKKFGF